MLLYNSSCGIEVFMAVLLNGRKCSGVRWSEVRGPIWRGTQGQLIQNQHGVESLLSAAPSDGKGSKKAWN